MEYTHHYDSPLGGITLASDGNALTGLWFDGQMVRYLFQWKRTKFHSTIINENHSFSRSGLENYVDDSFWTNNDLWRNC